MFRQENFSRSLEVWENVIRLGVLQIVCWLRRKGFKWGLVRRIGWIVMDGKIGVGGLFTGELRRVQPTGPFCINKGLDFIRSGNSEECYVAEWHRIYLL